MSRIVLTGGTFAGKSSIADLFRQDGYAVIGDVGFEIIEELNDESGQDAQKRFRAEHPVDFYSRILKRQAEKERDISSDVVIFDRGAYDYVAMMESKDIPVPDSLAESVGKFSYDIAFVFEPLSGFEERKDSGRSFDKNDSLKLTRSVKEKYEQSGSAVVVVKEMPLHERYDFVRECIRTQNSR